MTSSVQDPLSAAVTALCQEEETLEAKAAEMDAALSGLKDLDVLLRLAEVKLECCLCMMRMIARGDAPEELRGRVSEKALSALAIVEGLLTENVSEDQKDAVSQDPRYAPVKEKLQEFILRGGGGMLESRETDEAKRRTISKDIVACIRKYARTDDRYEPIEPDEYPDVVRRILFKLFPAFMKEHPQKPPYGIEEGEETVYSSPKMKLPVSQAALYIEEEVLPELRKKLQESPGDRLVQKEIQEMERKAEEFKKLRFFPRSVPVLLEQGYYTEGLTAYAANGEMLVPIPVPVSMKSGTNMDRRMELVRMELVKRLAGKGVSAELDAEYKRLKSLESGPRGSSRFTALKIDSAWGFLALKGEFPALGRLEDRKGFGEIEKIAVSGSAAVSARRISSLLKQEEGHPNLPRLT
jgi:hypothetical protein